MRSSHHPLHQKLGVVRTLRHRCNTIVTKEQDRVTELDALEKALSTCGYPKWTFTRTAEQTTEKRRPHRDKPERTKGMVVLPYTQGISEKLCRIFKKHQVNVALKPANSIRRTLVAPKDKTPPQQACGIVYQIGCGDCKATYIGESGRQLRTRLQEHKKSVAAGNSSSALSEHQLDSRHNINWDSTRIIDRETEYFPRKVREAIHIRRQRPEMNRDGGLELPHIYDRVLIAAPPSGRDANSQSEEVH